MTKCIIDKCKKKIVSDYFMEKYCQEHTNESVKLEYQEKLKDIKNIYVVGLSMSSGIWSRFQLYYIKDNEPIRIWLGMADKSHWVKPRPNFKGGYFHNTVLGMDRIFDIVYSLGYWLFNDGYRFKEHFLSSL